MEKEKCSSDVDFILAGFLQPYLKTCRAEMGHCQMTAY